MRCDSNIDGSTGAGKTTLLNLLAGRIHGGKHDGSILINGVSKKKLSRRKWQRLTAYVMQDDLMLGNLTPVETFSFSALLRLGDGVYHPVRTKRKVKALLQELGLMV